MFERIPHWIEQELDQIAARFTADHLQGIELHGNPMHSGKGAWRHQPKEKRVEAIKDALRIAVKARFPKSLRVFASVLEKQDFSGSDVGEIAFEQLSSRFDQYLGRLHKKQNTQRGLILLDRCSTEVRLQTLAREFKHTGHSFGTTRNFAEVPVFLDSRASRLIQLADLVAYAIFRHYEHQDSRYYEIIAGCFDAEGGINHGLYSR